METVFNLSSIIAWKRLLLKNPKYYQILFINNEIVYCMKDDNKIFYITFNPWLPPLFPNT